MPVSKQRARVAEGGGPYWSAPGAALYLGDVRECLRRLPARSVHCCVTSPPYWGLRDYGTGTWEGGSAECDHVERYAEDAARTSMLGPNRHLGISLPETNAAYKSTARQFAALCRKCGARRTDMQIGAEPSPDCCTQGQAQCGGCFVCSMVGVFREVRRVLRGDGTVWLNLGDTYGGRGNTMGDGVGGNSGKNSELRRQYDAATFSGSTNLPSGNLVGVPWRVALALQADGWILRQDIIWHSPNKMPESVTNRCTKSHEHIFLLAKGEGYYYDAVAVQEPAKSKYRSSDFLPDSDKDAAGDKTAATPASRSNRDDEVRTQDVNKRDVWIVPTTGYPGAHFAVYSPRLITPCILAGTSEYGCCAKCGMPYERVVVREGGESNSRGESLDNLARDRSFDWSRNGKPGTGSTLDGEVATKGTAGWRKACACRTDEVVPATVLDPFVGSGTTVATALELGRAGVGIDLSEAYLRECAIPRIEGVIAGGSASGRRRAVGEVVIRGVAPLPVERMRGV